MTAPPSGLRQAISGRGFFALSFGGIVGSGWVMVLGEWLGLAGPGGAIVGFACGGAVMMVVGLCYAELAHKMPSAGGEVLYALQGIGPLVAQLVGWFLTLNMIAIMAFEGISLAWFLQKLLPQIATPPLYTVLGSPVTADALTIGVGASIVFAAINLTNVRSAMIVQNVITYGFVMMAIGLILIGLTLGSSDNALPLFTLPSGKSWVLGALWIFGTSALFLNGFQTGVHAIEERSAGTSLARAMGAMLAGIAAASIFYGAIVLAASFASPWQGLIKADLPAASAFAALTPGGILGTCVIVAATISLLKTWNAIMLMAARLMYAQAQLGFLPAWLGRLSPSGVPQRAVLFLMLLSMSGNFLGRGAVVPIVNMASVCLAFSFIFSLIALLRLRAREPVVNDMRLRSDRRPLPLWLIRVALAGTTGMAAVAGLEPFTRSSGVPLEWMLIACWSVLGVLFGAVARRRDRRSSVHEESITT